MFEKISVIVVTYNRLQYLKLTVDGILQQTYKNLEVIVVADGDQSDVREYISNHDDQRLSYSFVDHCGYPAKGRNLGIEKTSGAYIAFCDDDDIWLPNKLELQMRTFQLHKDLVLCCTNRAAINSEGVITGQNSLRLKPSKSSLGELLISNFVSYSSVLLKRTVLEKTGLFPDDIKFKAIEDYHLWIRVAYFGEILFLDEPLVLYRIHDSNITTRFSIGAAKNIQLFNELFKKYNFKPIDKIKAYSMAYFKIFFYQLKELNKSK